jgi:hypothetical protein
MPNWIKIAGKWGAIFLGVAVVAGLGFVVFFPELSTELTVQPESKWGSIFVILALIITLLKQIIGFIGFLTGMIKIGIILLFVILFLGIGIMILRTWKSSQASKE